MAGWAQHLLWRIEAGACAGLGAGLAAMPIERASALGGRVARAIGPRMSVHRVADRNLQIAFPERDAAWRAQILARVWDNIGRTFAEMPHLRTLDCYEPGGRITVEGVERLDALRESGGPAVFVAGHFANWEVMAMAGVQRGVKGAITYRAANNPYFDEQIKVMRRAYGVETLTPKAGARGARELMEHLAAGRAVALMNDQKFNAGIETPFFGYPAMTAPGPTRLAMRAGAPLIPMSARRLYDENGDGARFLVQVHEPIPITDVAETVAAINRFLEDRIRESPADWFWVHRRFHKDVYRTP